MRSNAFAELLEAVKSPASRSLAPAGVGSGFVARWPGSKLALEARYRLSYCVLHVIGIESQRMTDVNRPDLRAKVRLEVVPPTLVKA